MQKRKVYLVNKAKRNRIRLLIKVALLTLFRNAASAVFKLLQNNSSAGTRSCKYFLSVTSNAKKT